MLLGFLLTWTAADAAYGGIFRMSVVVPVVVLGLTMGTFLCGVALMLLGGYRCCRRLSSR